MTGSRAQDAWSQRLPHSSDAGTTAVANPDAGIAKTRRRRRPQPAHPPQGPASPPPPPSGAMGRACAPFGLSLCSHWQPTRASTAADGDDGGAPIQGGGVAGWEFWPGWIADGCSGLGGGCWCCRCPPAAGRAAVGEAAADSDGRSDPSAALTLMEAI